MDHPPITQPAAVLKPLTWPPIRVDVKIEPSKMAAMIARVEANFRHMGETEPHWSVLTDSRFKSDQITATSAEFFESGRGPVDAMLATLNRCDCRKESIGTCLELGCGVGRSTIWLAEQFDHVIAADISPPHLAVAREACGKWERQNVSFLHISSMDALAQAAPFDLFFSVIVLQHNPPPVIYRLLHDALRGLSSGGVAYFQVPTYRRGYSFDADAYLQSPLRLGVPEMHVLPQPVLHKLIAESGCQTLEMREDGAAGGDNISSRLLVRKW